MTGIIMSKFYRIQISKLFGSGKKGKKIKEAMYKKTKKASYLVPLTWHLFSCNH